MLAATPRDKLCQTVPCVLPMMAEIAKINNLLEQYFIYGGFPASIDFKNKREYVSSVYQKVLYNDIITHNKVRSENGMKLLIKKISESVMQDISYTKLQNIITGIGYKISKCNKKMRLDFYLCFL